MIRRKIDHRRHQPCWPPTSRACVYAYMVADQTTFSPFRPPPRRIPGWRRCREAGVETRATRTFRALPAGRGSGATPALQPWQRREKSGRTSVRCIEVFQENGGGRALLRLPPRLRHQHAESPPRARASTPPPTRPSNTRPANSALRPNKSSSSVARWGADLPPGWPPAIPSAVYVLDGALSARPSA